MKITGINTRVILLALLPVTAVSIILFSVFITKQFNDIDNNLITKGNSLAEHLSSASEFGIFSRNSVALNNLIEFTRKQNEVSSVVIQDDQQNILASYFKTNEQGDLHKDNFLLFKTREYSFKKAVIQTPINISDFQDITGEYPTILGWITISLTDQVSVSDKVEAIYDTLFITMVILCISGFIALRIGRHISQPIITITNTVKEIEAGNLDTPFDIQSSGELDALAKGIKAMTTSLKNSRHDYIRQINDKTLVLEKSLMIVEKQNEDLLAARQVALVASRTKSDFLANISHEIRTPMNGIIGYIRLLMETQPSREQTEYLDTIEKSAINLLTLLNDVIDLSKVEAGKLDIHSTTFNLRECIDDVLLLMAPSAYEKKLEIASIFYDDTPDILIGAPDRIRQILINLIGNAIKFSNHGTITVRTMMETESSHNATLKITVSDQGIGISELNQEKIFNSFTQIDNTLTREYEGAGLGLTISKSLAEAMGGGMGVESSQDHGSKFWFSFITQKADPAQHRIGNTPVTNEKIFLYDSNEITGLGLLHSFRRLGFDAELFTETEAFIHRLTANNDCKLAAISLNHANIEQRLYDSLIQQVHVACKAKIIAFISYSNPSIANTIRDAGADTCLSKPHRHAELRKAVINLVPGAQEDMPQKPEVISASPISSRNTKPLNGISLLIAEDNTINAKLITTLLEREGASIILAKNGVEAIQLFKSQDVDLILMDIHMPELSGIDATKAIRQLGPKGQEMPILGLTANTQSDDHKELIEKGINAILTKPVSSDVLVETILLWLQDSDFSAEDSRLDQPIPVNQNQSEPPFEKLGIPANLESNLRALLIKELPTTSKRIQRAYKSRQWKELQEICHQFLGGMSYCDVPQLKLATKQFHHGLKYRRNDLEVSYQTLIYEINRHLSEQ